MTLAQPMQHRTDTAASAPDTPFDDAELEALILNDLLAPEAPDDETPEAAAAEDAIPEPEPGRSPAAEVPTGDGTADDDDLRFETTVAETAAAVGGVVMFQMQLGAGDEARWVAAVALGEPEARRIVMIELPVAGGEAVISPAEESDLPIAGIAGAYAGLAECWGAAA